MMIYAELLDAFGAQRWWPTTLAGDEAPSYHGKPLDAKGRFEVAVGAVLTQNTNWGNVERAVINLSRGGLLSPKGIMGAEDSAVIKAIRPSGYYNIKLRRLRAMTSWWLSNVSDAGLAEKVHDLAHWRDSILGVKGVGRETADSILLYCFELPTFVIDTYTRRVMARHFGVPDDIDYDELRDIFMRSLPADPQLFKEFHALFVRLAKEACRKSVCLDHCPMRGVAAAGEPKAASRRFHE